MYRTVYSSGKQHVRALVAPRAFSLTRWVPLKLAISVGAVFSSAAVYDLTVAVTFMCRARGRYLQAGP